MDSAQTERHFVVRVGWLRAAVLGANDGILSTDELGISDAISANPIEAAMTSAATFSSGGILPVLAALVAPRDILVPAVFGVSLAILALLGAVGAKAGGAAILKPTLRVAFWGAIAMAVTEL